MTTFQDGPAEGSHLCLARAPVFLRVVVNAAGAIDALDQLDDVAGEDEKIFAYRIVGGSGSVHVDGRDKSGKRFGRWYRYGDYKLVATQPDEATLRDNKAWAEWCLAQPRED